MERRHGVKTALGRQHGGMVERRVEIFAVLNLLRAERAHRTILVRIIAMRHHHHCREVVALRGKRDALAVIATGRRHHTA